MQDVMLKNDIISALEWEPDIDWSGWCFGD